MKKKLEQFKYKSYIFSKKKIAFIYKKSESEK